MMAAQTTRTRKLLDWRRVKFLFYWPWELVPLLFVFGSRYRETMPPGMSSWIVEGWDSAVLQITGSTWGIPHSPGYPLYTLMANVFVRLVGLMPGGMGTDVAWRVSLWSTTTSLLTLVFTYFTVYKLTRDRVAGVVATSILAASFMFWRGAIMAEVYSLNALIFVFAYWLALSWADDLRDRWLVALGLVVGAGMAHHRTAMILPPTIALWVLVQSLARGATGELPSRPWPLVVGRRWLILAGAALLPLLSYLYLPWAAQYRAGQTWLYANTADWNTFWFVVLGREWWGLVKLPASPAAWTKAFSKLFAQQADQITSVGVVAGLAGLVTTRRRLVLLGPPLLSLVWFGVSYRVADLDSMLIPLTLTLCIGLGALVGNTITWAARIIRIRRAGLNEDWMRWAVRGLLSLILLIGVYLVFRPLAQANYHKVNLSGDWQAVDLIEEVEAIAAAGTPLTIIGQDNSVLPDFIYTAVIRGQPVEPLSTTQLSRMPEAASIALLRDRFEQKRRVLVDIETLDLNFIPWLSQATRTGRIFLAPTGHPYLWELLPRPMSSVLPELEPWQQIPPGQFLDGQASIIAYHQRLIPKRTGCFLRLTLFWRAETHLDEDYFVAVQPLGGETALDKNDHLGLMRGYLPTSHMVPGEIVRDEVDLLVRQPAALLGVSVVTNLFQVRDNLFPTFGEVTLPITVDPSGCKR